MDAKVVWNGKMSFTGSADTGFEVPLDSSPAVGGENSGFRPLEFFAIGLAGCTAMDVISILSKKRQEVSAFEVKVHADQAQGHPHVFTTVKVEFIVTGKNVDPKAVERAIQLSQDIYCPAAGMLKKAVEIETVYQIIEG